MEHDTRGRRPSDSLLVGACLNDVRTGRVGGGVTKKQKRGCVNSVRNRGGEVVKKPENVADVI